MTRTLIIVVLGLMILFLGLTAVIGHLFDAPFWFWWDGEEVGMALNTAICFVITGVATIIIALRKPKK